MSIIDGISNSDYHAMQGISKSGLDLINRSPAHYYAHALDPNRPAEKEHAGQLEGTLAHCAILEPDEFAKRYAVGPDVHRSSKAWTAFEEANADRVCIKPDQYEAAMRQAESVMRLPEIAEALGRGKAEQSAFWTDEQTEASCRCRPDFVHYCGSSGVILLDVKTFSTASPDEFRRQVARKRYHVQDAFYSHGYSIASQRSVLAFVFVVVETEWPYQACALMLDDEAKAQGAIDYRRNLDVYAACIKTGQWPGYSTQIEVINLPSWALTE